MLKQRAATATVLVLLVLLTVFWLPTHWFALVLALFLLAAATEWSTLVGWNDGLGRSLWLIVICAGILITWWFRQYLIPITVVIGAIWWVWVMLMLCFSFSHSNSNWFKALSGIAVLVPAWGALIYLHQVNTALVMVLFVIVWLADIGAYFSGRQWGSHQLAPIISPGKTIEGLVGGIVLVISFSIVAIIWQGYDLTCASLLLGGFVITSLFSVVGDLWESKVKRAVNVKDSGSILPGHGGVLDRIDSVTAAAPVFAVFVYGLTREIGRCLEIH